MPGHEIWQARHGRGEKGHEPEHFGTAAETARTDRPSIARVAGASLAGTTLGFGGDIAFHAFTLFLLVYVPQRLGLPRSVALTAVLVGAVAQVIGILLAGWLSDRFGQRPVLLVGAAGGLVWAFAFFALVDTEAPGLVLLASFVGMLFASAMFSPLASFLPELFPTRVRCAGASLCSQFAGVFGGAPAPLIAVPLAAAVLAARETARLDLRGVDAAWA